MIERLVIDALLVALPPFIALCDYIVANAANLAVADALLDVVLVLLAVRRSA